MYEMVRKNFKESTRYMADKGNHLQIVMLRAISQRAVNPKEKMKIL